MIFSKWVPLNSQMVRRMVIQWVGSPLTPYCCSPWVVITWFSMQLAMELPRLSMKLWRVVRWQFYKIQKIFPCGNRIYCILVVTFRVILIACMNFPMQVFHEWFQITVYEHSKQLWLWPIQERHLPKCWARNSCARNILINTCCWMCFWCRWYYCRKGHLTSCGWE